MGLASTTVPGSGECAQISSFDPPLVAMPGETRSVLSGCLAPGLYLIVVRPLEFDPLACAGAGAYVLAVDAFPECGGPPPPPCPEDGDLDGDGLVGFEDFLVVLSNFGGCLPQQCPELGDLDGSFLIDFGDLLVILGHWGPCPG